MKEKLLHIGFDTPTEKFQYTILTASKQLENEERQNKSIQGKLYKLRKLSHQINQSFLRRNSFVWI